MAHFAVLDGSSVVTNVIVIDNDEMLNSDGDEVESLGVGICESVLGEGTYIQCSYNESFRKNYPSAGFTYDSTVDAFIPPDSQRPYPSWTLNPTTYKFEAPLARPETDARWDEANQEWVIDNE